MNLFKQYSSLVLQKPYWVILAVALLTLGALLHAGQFRLDASADSLVVDGDRDLALTRQVSTRFASSDFVFVVYRPHGELFRADTLADLKTLRNQLQELTRVESVDSLFSVPLFKLANATLADVADNIITLEDPGVDLSAAREDLMSNEAYRAVLLSEDGSTAALVVNFRSNEELQSLTEQREQLHFAASDEHLSGASRATARQLESRYLQLKKQEAANLHADISAIRGLLEQHREQADIFMGGVPMIADDLITFVKRDLSSFGLGIVVFVIAALWFFFRSLRFVVLPLACGTVILLAMVGLLGWLDWPVTVISSNFMSLLLIITVSLTVHLIVRYRELQTESPGQTHADRLQAVLRSMLLPCAYTSLTTVVAFGSLVISDIPPVIDFGLIMVIGVSCAFVLTFLLFPALAALLADKSAVASQQQSFDITPAIGRFTEDHRNTILLVAVVLFLVAIVGVSKLRVENSFIDYFDDSTDIYQGMVVIDETMGGTTPLDVVITMTPPNPFDNVAGSSADFDEADEWQDEWEEDEWAEEEGGDAWWFTSDKMQSIDSIHRYLESQEEVGKVLSLATLLNIAYELNDGQPLNTFELGILYSRIPESYQQSLLRPYVSVADDQVRFSLRIRETDPNLRRSELLDRINTGLQEEFGLAEEQIQLSGMLVLYNNMLQSLFESQIGTISIVMLAIFLMFMLLFRSVSLALLGIIPNILAALSVLGVMGIMGIPLDMMTITIAAIAIGIGVDNTIHYIHRFKSNFPRFGSYLHTMHYCHGSIGKAMYYTSFTIIAGFSILILSSFVPTVYFGLLTSLAMLLALAGSLTLLPLLIVLFKPLGPEHSKLA